LKVSAQVLFFNFPKNAVPPLKKAAQIVLKANSGGQKGDTLNFVLISDAEIRTLNKKYRNVDRVTDVISFRLSQKPLCGDIYIARGRSKKQAAEMKHSWKSELCYLALHGALHLFDYTDYTPSDKKKMFAVQDKLFSCLKGNYAVSR
jgi:probable rRNA maturation factor